MVQPRLRSSFIYLANAVNDILGNWTVVALALAPLVIVASLCLLPDALNLQYSLVHRLDVNVHNVGWWPVQVPFPMAQQAPARLVPLWATRTLDVLFILTTLSLNLIVLCMLARKREADWGAGGPVSEVVRIYQRAGRLFPSFLWVWLLQFFATIVGFILLVIPGLLAFIWLYFAQYALVIDSYRSWPALLFSRDLMRGRFFAVAVRIVVFLAVWSGYNSWAGGVFVVISVMLRIVGAITGFLWAGVLIADLFSVSVGFLTTAFFFAAGVRLYADLKDTLQPYLGSAHWLPTATLPAQGQQNSSYP